MGTSVDTGNKDSLAEQPLFVLFFVSRSKNQQLLIECHSYYEDLQWFSIAFRAQVSEIFNFEKMEMYYILFNKTLA